jgi:hypothetical protein
MNTRAGWYWIAVGVFALGVNSRLPNLNADCLKDAAQQAVEQISEQITQRVEPLALAVVDRVGATDRFQTDLSTPVLAQACERVKIVRGQAVVSPIELPRVRMIRLERVEPVIVRVPKRIEVHVKCPQVTIDQELQ